MNETIMTLFSILIFIFVWRVFWKKLMIDRLRNRLFELRAELFDYTVNNKDLSFGDNAYKNVEILLNGTIYKAPEISLLNTIIFQNLVTANYPGHKVEHGFVVDLNNSTKSIKNKTVKKHLNKILSDYKKEVTVYLVFSSLIITFIATITVLFYIIKELFAMIFDKGLSLAARVKKRISKSFEKTLIIVEDQSGSAFKLGHP